jgi:glucan phosphoethanolaminetransferase (alkaline phosphatase superfamily)
MNESKKKKKKSIIVIGGVIGFVCASVLGALSGDYRFLFIVCACIVVILIINYVIVPYNIGTKIDNLLKKHQKKMSVILFGIFTVLLLLIIILTFL